MGMGDRPRHSGRTSFVMRRESATLSRKKSNKSYNPVSTSSVTNIHNLP